jgi:hypothetical protein
MSLLREPSDWQRPERDRAAGAATHHKILRGARQRIGRGAFVCPACELPLLPPETVSISTSIRCPFCGGEQAARDYLRLDAIDTPKNGVDLIARLPA